VAESRFMNGISKAPGRKPPAARRDVLFKELDHEKFSSRAEERSKPGGEVKGRVVAKKIAAGLN